MPPPTAVDELVFDRAAVRAVDRAAIQRYGIPGIVLMENAARGLREVVLSRVPRPRAVLICCGSGNNGGDGHALARHLHNAGVRVLVAALGAPRPGGDAATNEAIGRAMGLERHGGPDDPVPDAVELVVDALLGTGLDRPVEGDARAWIRWMNGLGRPILAVDTPSGLDCDTGRPLGAAARAETTVTFVGWKAGFLAPGADAYTGRVIVADIGAPVELLREHGRPSSDP